MDSRWYSPEFIGQHFLKMREIIPDLKLALITGRSRDFIAPKLERLGIEADTWTLTSASPAEVPALLSQCTLGLVIQDKPNVWPVKFAEYLAVGLPVVVSKSAGEHLTGLVLKRRIGMVVDPDDSSSFAALKLLLVDLEGYRMRCIAYANQRLGIERTARQHKRLYQTLMAN
jgi:glycosyltransferase involved in cell wall biosynthesis